jgi:hypothetical protein
VSERFACHILGQHRSAQRKIAKTPDDEAALTADIIAFDIQYGRHGYRRSGAVAKCRLGGEREAGRADLAAGGAEGSSKATQEKTTLAQ